MPCPFVPYDEQCIARHAAPLKCKDTRMPPARSKKSPHAAAAAQIRELEALADDPEAQVAHAVALMNGSRHLEVVRTALAILARAEDPALRPALHAKYAW